MSVLVSLCVCDRKSQESNLEEGRILLVQGFREPSPPLVGPMFLIRASWRGDGWEQSKAGFSLRGGQVEDGGGNQQEVAKAEARGHSTSDLLPPSRLHLPPFTASQ